MIKKINFQNGTNLNNELEIVKLNDFFKNKNQNHLEKNFRLNFYLMLYIVKGNGVHKIDFKEYQYTDSSLIIISKNQINSFVVNNNIEGYIVIVSENFFIEEGDYNDLDLLRFFDNGMKKKILKINTDKKITSRILIDALYSETTIEDEPEKKLIKSLFASFIYAVRKENKIEVKDDEILFFEHYYKYKKLVDENFLKLKKVNDYEKLLNLSRKTINKSCQICAGVTAKEVITSRIIIECKRLLLKDSKKINEIAYYLGYLEPSNLSALFKKSTMVSMSNYKKNNI